MISDFVHHSKLVFTEAIHSYIICLSFIIDYIDIY